VLGSEMTANTLDRALTAAIALACGWPLFAFSMTHYLPLVDNDEVIYFLQVKTFLAHGFNGGNFFLNDKIPASRIHFGLHGPAFITLYGLFARVIGWHNYSPYVVNLLIFLAALLLLRLSLRSQPAARVVVALFVLTHGYFFLFLPSMMQESFHISVAILMAAVWKFARDRQSGIAWTALFVLTFMAMLTRYTWGLTLPFFVFSFLQQCRPDRSRRLAAGVADGTAAVIASVILTYAAMRLWVFWTAPASVNAQTLPAISMVKAFENLKALFSFEGINVFAKYPLFFRVSTWVLLGGLAAATLFARSAASRVAAVYSLGLLAVAMLAQALFYTVDGYRDFRVLAGFHALAGLAFFSRVELSGASLDPRARGVAVAAVVVFAALNFQFTVEGARLRYSVEWQRSKGVDADRSAKLLFAAIADHMAVAPEDTSFCKTIYGPVDLTSDPRLIHLPLGFGFSAIVPTEPDKLPPLRGKYALLGSASSPMKNLFDVSPDWRLVGGFGQYCLYRSTVNCQDSGRFAEGTP
jgi:hypothetical protein